MVVDVTATTTGTAKSNLVKAIDDAIATVDGKRADLGAVPKPLSGDYS